MMAEFRQGIRALLVIGVFLVATQTAGEAAGVDDKGMYCKGTRNCSNTCLNDSCKKFMYECTYGCKSGRNPAACPAEKSTGNTGVIIGVTAGVALAVIIVIIVVAVCLVKRRNAQGEPRSFDGMDKHTYDNPAPIKDEQPYTELDDVVRKHPPGPNEADYEVPVPN